MKKIIGLLALLLLVNACDDGDIIIENIDLSDVSTQKCSENNVLYQIKGNKSIILEMSQTQFNELFNSVVGVKTKILSGELLYRIYDGTVATNNICGTIRPSTPNITEEWTSLTATIQVTTTAIKETTTEGIKKIIKFKHAIVLQNVNWQKPNGDGQQEAERPFGNYETLPNTLPFAFTKEDLKRNDCNNNSIYIVNASEALQLKLNAATFADLFPAVSIVTTKTAYLSTENKLVYTLFNTAVTNAYFCTSPLPNTPTVKEQWSSIAGSGENGKIEVKTENIAGNFKYTVTLKNTVLKKDANEIELGTSYVLGTFLKTL